MAKTCDHTSVGMFVWRDDTLLLIERKKGTLGFAVPAGHVDQDSTYEDAAIRELHEEVGLETTRMELLSESREENPCRREGGTWHHWKLFKVEATGEVRPSKDETKQFGWYLKDEIRELAQRTEHYQKGEISESEWQKNPGLEPVMYTLFNKLHLL
jgi:ADP-ribose pyrophosphatase YjhB (NUDIX family)